MARCYHGARIINDSKKPNRCTEPCVPGHRYCTTHLAEAMARVETVKDTSPFRGLRWPAYRAETAPRRLYS